MTERNKQSHFEDDQAIAPARVTLNAQPQPGGSRPGRGGSGHRLAIAGLAVSLLALFGVIFLLPDMIAPVQAPKAVNPAPEPPQTPAAASTESPWQDAQFAKARRETQAILQKMLEKQEALEKIGVQHWAADDYQQARQLAETADEHYRKHEFARAKSLYEKGLDQFESLLQRSESVFQAALEAGEKAIVDGNATRAREQFELAARIQPDHEEVSTGLERADVLKDVLAEIDAGKSLQRDGQLEAAREHYKAALQLDEKSQLAQERLRDVEGAIADRNFGKQMSLGFAAMDEGRYDQAISAFQQALKIRPEAPDARNALTQARNESTHSKLQTLLSRAQAREREEEWQTAVDTYRQALKLDENLVEARVGLIRAGTRAKIDSKMEAILASTERLTTPAVHDDYEKFYRETLAIQNPGPRLNRQLEQLNQALRLAVTPVQVEFRSDNATHVTVYRVGKLGSFDQTQLTLKPGTYTVVGTRDGYRDVRQDFTVSATQPPRSPITVQCVEKISQG